MRKKLLTQTPISLLFFISLVVSLFYFFYINLDTDSILLFLSQKLFLGNWLKKGIMPFYNPHIFLGTPFAFDPGLGNLHPFNLFFLLPHPLSYAIWTGTVTFLFLSGFYVFFFRLTRNSYVGFLFALVFIFSGSGLTRLNNPTIYIVIAHWGWFLYTHFFIKTKKGLLFFLLIGVLMTLSGHLQFVLLGYLLGFILGVYESKITCKRILFCYGLLFLVTLWYYVLSIPIIVESTRWGMSHLFLNDGKIQLQQLLQIFFPYIHGSIRSGYYFGAGPKPILGMSLMAIIFLFFSVIKKRISLQYLILIFSMVFVSLGMIAFPFFRVSQIWSVIHVLILVAISKHTVTVFTKMRPIYRFVIILIIVIEGIFFAYFHNFFIPQTVIHNAIPKKQEIKIHFQKLLVDASGNPLDFDTYMDSYIHRSRSDYDKELVNQEERNGYIKLQNMLTKGISSWASVTGDYTVQGYGTFVPNKLLKLTDGKSSMIGRANINTFEPEILLQIGKKLNIISKTKERFNLMNIRGVQEHVIPDYTNPNKMTYKDEKISYSPITHVLYSLIK